MARDIGDDWVDIGDEYSDIKPKQIDAQDDHVKADDQNKAKGKAAENNEKTCDDEGKIVTREIQVAQNMAIVFDGKDNIIELELLSGAKVLFTKKRCHDDDDEGSNNYIVRVIGYSKSAEKAEKLIKAVVGLVDAGGIELLQFNKNNKSNDSAAVSGLKPVPRTQLSMPMQPPCPYNPYGITEYPVQAPKSYHQYVDPFHPFYLSAETTPIFSHSSAVLPQGKSQGPFNQSDGSFTSFFSSPAVVTQPPPSQWKSQAPFNQSGGTSAVVKQPPPPPQGKSQGPFNQSAGGTFGRPVVTQPPQGMSLPQPGKNAAAASKKGYWD